MLTTLAVLIALRFGSPQTQLIGADNVLKSLKVTAKTKVKPKLVKLNKAIDTYIAASAKLSPAQAAKGWLQLLDVWEDFARDPATEQNEADLDDLVCAIPRPDVWPQIRTGLASRTSDKQAMNLRIVFDLLLGDDNAVLQGCETFRKKPDPFDTSGIDFNGDEISKIELPIALRSGNLTLATKILVNGAKSRSFFFFDGVPDLAGLLGAEKAKPILKQMMAVTTESIDKINGLETRNLARSIVLAESAKVGAPQWTLAEGPEASSYVSNMVARFGVKALDGANVEVTGIYIVGLLDSGKSEEAIGYLAKKGLNYWGKVTELDNARSAALMNLLAQALDRNPTTDCWDAYLGLAKKLGRSEEAARKVDSFLALTELSDSVRKALLVRKGDIAAAQGDDKAAVRFYIEASRIPDGSNDRSEVRTKLIKIANATGNREAIDAALLTKSDSSSDDGFKTLVDQGRLSDAQKLILRLATTPPTQFERGGLTFETPVALAELYFLADRPHDIIELLDSYPSWQADDLSEVLTLRRNARYRNAFRGESLGYYAAWALAKTGKKELAVPILHRLLYSDLDSDDPYQLLNELEGAPALAFYERLKKLDPYATRPLIWTADLLQRLGRTSEAEAAARKAIAMDPTDGEAPEGHRLMSYSVLARILRAKNDVAQADLYERIVKAVRISERADRYREAGMLPQALKLYEESSATFADAYCVHARMAITLAEGGRMEESLEHFKRAYELMPESFGQIESMCMGCEGTFLGFERSNLALTVFEKLAKEFPERPQVHYLLGQLYASVDDPKKALASYEEAVRLDPRYFNALKELIDLAGLGVGSPTRMEQAALALIRLDPLSLHGSYSATGIIRNYAELWRIYAAASASLPRPPVGALYPLRKTPPTRTLGWSGGMSVDQGPADSPLFRGPGGGLSQIAVIQAITRLKRDPFS